MIVRNNYSAPLGLPGKPGKFDRAELQPGDNEVDSAVWAEAAQAEQVQAWIKSGLVVIAEAGKKKA